ncbi:MAG: alpha/beta hydrolase [Furfurilactobacillus sp.]|uniref:Alpha/beta hydrolase n=1 Tax=Furfurilactobacillus milii TaxID=2888272 RepID=A0ABT6DBE4_9LACO|nr:MULTISPECIES: alpha/beta hydrolase [Furfurilactobacillus]QLE67330.1 cell surface hydrolase membrane-bound [Furfurilactobacillus rossiae]MCF6161589.1 alpha/beta hydrolase [Furfurilactobacillus milii]MCF6163969.1 alpha/beta hydrolase [Furfurilactobacillus milii]MCF6419385.1 alpha/beta hydrolase [Furfurilactobacillus milii]MCH4011519.1 alpha/beta hydrolase [Furfurilactobacillus sp.]
MGEQKHAVPQRPAKQDRFIRWLIGVLCAVLVLAGIVMGWEASEQKQLGHVQVSYSKTPTLFVSGDYSNWLTFGPMNARLERYDIGQAVWTIHVAKSGKATIDKRGPLGKRNPLILVLFADNHHASREARQLTGVMKMLKQREHINTVNMVGHSSGANIVYQYLTGKAADKREDYPDTAKFVNIATTFSKAEQKAADRFPRHIQVLNIAGDLFGTGGDLGVSVKGDHKLGEMLAGRVDGYQSETLVGGISVIHYLLHQNPHVDRAVTDFLWQARFTPQTNYPR